MKSSFGQYGPLDDHYVLSLRRSSDMPNLQVWRGMAQSKKKIDYTKDFYYIDRPYWGESRGTPYWMRCVKNEHVKTFVDNRPDDRFKKTFKNKKEKNERSC